MDEMTRANKIKNLENYKREEDALTKQKVIVTEQLNLYKKKIALLEKNAEIIINNFKYNEPKWEYEKVPEYIDNLREINKITMEENKINWKNQVDMMTDGLLRIDEQLTVITAKTIEVTKELEEVNKDGE